MMVAVVYHNGSGAAMLARVFEVLDAGTLQYGTRDDQW